MARQVAQQGSEGAHSANSAYTRYAYGMPSGRGINMALAEPGNSGGYGAEPPNRSNNVKTHVRAAVAGTGTALMHSRNAETA